MNDGSRFWLAPLPSAELSRGRRGQCGGAWSRGGLCFLPDCGQGRVSREVAKARSCPSRLRAFASCGSPDGAAGVAPPSHNRARSPLLDYCVLFRGPLSPPPRRKPGGVKSQPLPHLALPDPRPDPIARRRHPSRDNRAGPGPGPAAAPLLPRRRQCPPATSPAGRRWPAAREFRSDRALAGALER